jgi:putative spermidine/putrescine transport system permease protein
LSGVLLIAFAVGVLIFLVLPVFIIIPISFSSATYLTFPPPGWSSHWYQQYFSSDDWIAATIQSFKVGIGAVVVTLILGVPLAYALVRTHFRGKFIVDALVISPMILPAIILAIGDYLLFVRFKLVGSTWALILGHA